jgi:hypothetical protein
MMQSAAQFPATQISPVVQLVPSAALLQEVVLFAGTQLWQIVLAGFAALAA